MPVKIRLQRHGKKGNPFYHIVVADSRAPRDGRFIERIGSYNPVSNPATIEIDVDRAVTWLHNGAQPTDTTRAILSYKGVLYKKHLDTGVKKGAMTAEQAEERYNSWLEDKNQKVEAKRQQVSQGKHESISKQLDQESKVREERAKALMAKRMPPAEEAPVAAEEAPVTAAETPAAAETPEAAAENAPVKAAGEGSPVEDSAEETAAPGAQVSDAPPAEGTAPEARPPAEEQA